MNYGETIGEIFRKAERVDGICKDLNISDADYGRGFIEGADNDGVTFFYTSCGDVEYYSIPYEWLEMEEDKLRDYLLIREKEKKEKEMLDKAKREEDQKEALYQARRTTYEALKKEFENEQENRSN